MSHLISEIQIVPIKPRDGLVAFSSVVLDHDIYLGGIGIYTRPGGGYRLSYPTRRSGTSDFSIYHPIHREMSEALSEVIISKYEEVTNNYDRHDNLTPEE